MGNIVSMRLSNLFLCVCVCVHCRAIAIHSVDVSQGWRLKAALGMNYDTIKDLQPCSLYAFKVQVLIAGARPGPFSAAVLANTTKIGK